jgi:hypothetical protein
VLFVVQGMSGRALRKLPIKAHAFFLQRPTVCPVDFTECIGVVGEHISRYIFHCR